jgi:hypothetical protein
VLFGIVEDDLGSVSSSCPILVSDINRFKIVDNDVAAKYEGCYLYFDNKKRRRFVRSGKAVGQQSDFGIRNDAHVKASKRVTTSSSSSSSEFYTAYPAKSCASDVNKIHGLRRGYFDDLVMCIGLAFNREDSDALELICDQTNGIFVWPEEILQFISRASFNHSPSLKDKQLHMVGYMVELVLDLMISPIDCVSQSPGFESCLHIFGNTD